MSSFYWALRGALLAASSENESNHREDTAACMPRNFLCRVLRLRNIFKKVFTRKKKKKFLGQHESKVHERKMWLIEVDL